MNSISGVIGIARRCCVLMVLSLFTAHFAEAADYAWIESGRSGSWADPFTACSTNFAADYAAVGGAAAFPPGISSYHSDADMSSVTTYNCRAVRNSDGYRGFVAQTTRTGTACPAGKTYNATTGLCDAPACPSAGTDAGLENITIGWTNAPQITPPPLTIDSRPAGGITGSSMCVSLCKVTATGIVNAYKATAPSSSGLYRLSVDVSTAHTGVACTVSSATPDPTAPPSAAPACPGSAGTVNGQAVCLDSAAHPPPLSVTPAPVAGNPIPGKPTVAGTGASTPSYSTDPATGAGSGLPPGSTTPSGSVTVPNGSGATASGANVTVNVPDSPAKECGGPGRPACKMDEAGTPDGTSAFNTAKTALDQAVSDHVGQLGNVVSDAGKDASWGWLPQLPTGNCTPFVMASLGSVDWCPIVPKLKEIMSWILGTLTALSILSMVHKTIRGT